MADDPFTHTNGVQVSPQAIYDRLGEVRDAQRETTQTMRELVLPTLATHTRQITTLNFKFYAIVGGFGAALAVVLKLGGVY